MKYVIALLASFVMVNSAVWAEGEQGGQEVQPQLFDDLNSNTVSDKTEETAANHEASSPEVVEIVLPDTPPEEIY